MVMQAGEVLQTSTGEIYLLKRVCRPGVWVAELQTTLETDHLVVVRQLYTDRPLTSEMAALLQAEFAKAIQPYQLLLHPGLADIYGSALCGNAVFWISEYVPGKSLRELITAGEMLPSADLERIAEQLGQALLALHTLTPALFVPTLSPGQILLRPAKQAVLVHLPLQQIWEKVLATVTSEQASTAKRKPKPKPLSHVGYAAPEQFGTVASDERADLFALGAVLYHLASGVDPALTPLVFSRLESLRPDLAPALCYAIGKSLALAPAERWSEAGQFVQALHEPPPPLPPPKKEPTPPRVDKQQSRLSESYIPPPEVRHPRPQSSLFNLPLPAFSQPPSLRRALRPPILLISGSILGIIVLMSVLFITLPPYRPLNSALTSQSSSSTGPAVQSLIPTSVPTGQVVTTPVMPNATAQGATNGNSGIIDPAQAPTSTMVSSFLQATFLGQDSKIVARECDGPPAGYQALHIRVKGINPVKTPVKITVQGKVPTDHWSDACDDKSYRLEVQSERDDQDSLYFAPLHPYIGDSFTITINYTDDTRATVKVEGAIVTPSALQATSSVDPNSNVVTSGCDGGPAGGTVVRLHLRSVPAGKVVSQVLITDFTQGDIWTSPCVAPAGPVKQERQQDSLDKLDILLKLRHPLYLKELLCLTLTYSDDSKDTVTIPVPAR